MEIEPNCLKCVFVDMEPVCYDVYGDEGIPIEISEDFCCGSFMTLIQFLDITGDNNEM